MTDQEDNLYKAALGRARTRIGQERDAFDIGGDPTSAITRAIATDGGWDCSEADGWLEDLSHQVSGLREAFDQAWNDINSAHEAQPDKVDEGDWRGRSYYTLQSPLILQAY